MSTDPRVQQALAQAGRYAAGPNIGMVYGLIGVARALLVVADEIRKIEKVGGLYIGRKEQE